MKRQIPNVSKWRSALLAAALSAGGSALCAAPASNIFGFLGYCQSTTSEDEQTRNGWYKINGEDGSTEVVWYDTLFGSYGTYFTVGWVRDGRLCGYYGNASQKFYMEFDVKTGEKLTETEIDVQGENAHKHFLTGAYNPADDCVYGFSLNVDRTVDYYVKAPASDPTAIEIVRQIPLDFIMPVSCCFSPVDNHMYGIDQFGDLIRIDVYGNFEVAGEFADMSGEKDANIAGFESGMVYSPRDNAFFWNRQTPSYETSLVRIDASEGHEWTKITDLPWLDQYTVMYCPDTDGDENGPAAPVLVKADFPGADGNGTVTFRMPALSADGSALSGTLDWTAVDGIDFKSGTAAPGEEVKVEYSGLTSGEHNFVFRASASGAKGASSVCNTWVGADVPMPPTDVTLAPLAQGRYTLSWTAPASGAHNGYLNRDNLRYAIFLDGKQVGAAQAECTAEVSLPTDQDTRQYYFEVMALADGMQSEFGRSNSVFVGRGYGLPYSVIPEGADAQGMTFINVDNDRSNWSVVKEVGKTTSAFYTNRDWDNKGNDWLITPPLWFENPGKVHNVSFDVKYHNPNKCEEFYEVWVGTSPTADDMREIRVTPKTRVNDKLFYNVSYDFEIPAAGTYYVGIRYVGDADQGGIYVRNLKVSETGKSSGVESVDATEEIRVDGLMGALRVSGAEGQKVCVFDAGARKVSDFIASGSDTLALAPGLYIVSVGQSRFKVLVK